jgi:hypothetical protein
MAQRNDESISVVAEKLHRLRSTPCAPLATDDYSAHPWTLQEIEAGAVNDGQRFFDFRA